MLLLSLPSLSICKNEHTEESQHYACQTIVVICNYDVVVHGEDVVVRGDDVLVHISKTGFRASSVCTATHHDRLTDFSTKKDDPKHHDTFVPSMLSRTTTQQPKADCQWHVRSSWQARVDKKRDVRWINTRILLTCTNTTQWVPHKYLISK